MEVKGTIEVKTVHVARLKRQGAYLRGATKEHSKGSW